LKKLFGSLILAMLMLSITVPLVCAQDNGALELSEETTTLLKVVGSWLLYSLLGLIASVSTKGPDGKQIPFDAEKIGKSLVWMAVAAVLAIALNLNPQVVVAEQANLINEIVNFIVNTGVFVPVIYGIDKLYTIATNLLKTLKATAEKSP
jgi:hypothetical protein